MKKGPPSIDNIIPTGIMIGANKVRPIVSANNINSEPKLPNMELIYDNRFPQSIDSCEARLILKIQLVP